MHPDDEAEFAAHALADESVVFINGPRWKTEQPETFRSLDSIGPHYAIIWSRDDFPQISARFIPTCQDWYCHEYGTIQFLRSRIFEDKGVLMEGRLATHRTEDLSKSEFPSQSRRNVISRYNSYLRFLKKRYRNRLLQWVNPSLPLLPAGPNRSANPSMPDPQVWVGPRALAWLRQSPERCVKQLSVDSVVGAKLAVEAIE